MKPWLILTQSLWLTTGCEPEQKTALPAEPWPTEAEELFQQAEVLKYEVEQQQLEMARLKDQGLEGAPPGERR
ncbi:hypothetical protein [Thiolapillus sp.]